MIFLIDTMRFLFLPMSTSLSVSGGREGRGDLPRWPLTIQLPGDRKQSIKTDARGFHSVPLTHPSQRAETGERIFLLFTFQSNCHFRSMWTKLAELVRGMEPPISRFTAVVRTALLFVRGICHSISPAFRENAKPALPLVGTHKNFNNYSRFYAIQIFALADSLLLKIFGKIFGALFCRYQ